MHFISRVGGFPSFFKSTRSKIVKTFRVFICSLIAFQPMMIELAYAQEIVIDPSGNVGFNPTVRNTPKAPVVDIARPNTGGVSHNKFTKFNVDSKGVVLNNSASTSNTSLNGSVAGNANLINGTASTIVNEVTSTGNSTLAGTTEVAGDRANVIIANPNGILCNGCNFINAGDATLTTGTPVIDGGNVRLNVTQGTVTIGRNGLNGSQNNVANVNLIGRTVVVDGKVTAIDGVNVQGGAQAYDLTNKRHAGALTGVNTNADYAIDGTEFGAMEAGRIQIVGNERGLGVRSLGALQSTVSDVAVTTQSDLKLRSAAAQGRAKIFSRYGSVEIERDVTSATADVDVYARSNFKTTDRTGVYGATGIKIIARKGTLSFGGDIQSGVNIDLYGERLLTFAGYGSAAGEFKLGGRGHLDIDGATIVADEVAVSDGSTLFEIANSAVFSLNDFRINTRDFHLGKDVVVDGLTNAATSKLIVTATGMFINGSDLRRHQAADITYAGNLINAVGGIIEETHLNIAFDKDIQNSGILYGSETLKLDVKNLFNTETGAILSKSIDIDAKTLLENKGTISSEGNITLDSDTQVINSGYIQAIRATVKAPTIKNDGNGEIRLRDLGTFTATNRFENAGILASLDDLKVITETFENKGLVSVGDILDVAANKITNHETLTSGSTIKLVARDDILNEGQIASFGAVALYATDRVDNTGAILADERFYVKGTGFYNTGDNALLRANRAYIYPGQIKNSGKVYLISDFSRRGDIDYFENKGVFASAGKISLSARDEKSKIYLAEGSVLVSGLQSEVTTERQEFTSTDIGKGIAAGDNATGSGYILYVDGADAARFSHTEGANSKRFFAAVYNETLDQWFYDDNKKLVEFTPTDNDRLVANVDFSTDEVQLLKGQSKTIGGVRAGYADGDLVITPNQWGGKGNSGEFDLNLTYLKFQDETQTLIAGKSTGISFENLDIRGRIASGGHLYLTGANSLIIRDQLQAGGNLYLKAPTTTLIKAAKVNADGVGVFTATNTFTNAGVINLGGYIQLSKDFGSFSNSGVIAAASTNKFSLLGNFVNSGLFQTEGSLSISAPNLTNSGHLQAGSGLGLYARKLIIDDQGQKSYVLGNLVHSGTLAAVNSVSLIGSRITVDNNAFLSATQLNVSANRFYNKGSVSLSGTGRNEWTLEESLYQYGTTYSAGDFRIRANAIATYTDSLIASDKTLSISAAAGASLAGRLAANRVIISANTVSGAATSSVFAADDIDLRGTVSASHRGELAAGDNVSVSSSSIALDGAVFGETVVLNSKKSTKDSSNRARIYARKTFFAETAARFYNYGQIEARDSLRISTGDLYNQVGSGLASTVVDVRASRGIINYGRFFGAKQVSLIANGSLTNAASGEIETVSLGFNARRFDNRGSIDVYGLFGESYEGTTNYGSINAKTYFGLNAREVQNRENGKIHSDGHLFIKTSSYLKSYKNSEITGEVVDLRGAVTNDGLIQAQDVVNIANTTGSFINGTTGVVYGKTIAFNLRNIVVNRGKIGQIANSSLPKTDLVNIFGKESIANLGLIQANDVRLLSEFDIALNESGSITASAFLGVKSIHGNVLNQGVIRAENSVIEAGGNFDNRGSLRVGDTLNIDVKNVVYNRSLGTVNADIRAQNLVINAYKHIENSAYLNGNTALVLNSTAGTVSSTTDINGQGALQVVADSIDLQGRVKVTNSVSLLSNKYDIVVGSTIQTKTLLVDAKRNIKAVGNAFRGKEFTQLVANDILRTDTLSKSAKLASIADAKGDISVRLRTGSLGLDAGSQTVAIVDDYLGRVAGGFIVNNITTVYESVNWDVTGSIYLIADRGDISLSGKLHATDNIYISAGTSTERTRVIPTTDPIESVRRAAGLLLGEPLPTETYYVRSTSDTSFKNANLYAGNILHLEATSYLKNYGNTNISSDNQVELVQHRGWFRTSDWLKNDNIDYNLIAQAKTVVVDSDHRFVNKKLTLRASDNIWQSNHVISAKEVVYSAGNNITIRFNPFKWRDANPNAVTTGYWDTPSAGLRGHTILAQKGGITLFAGNDLILRSGKINTSGELQFVAGNNFISEPYYRDTKKNNRPSNVGWDFSNKYKARLSGHSSSNITLRELRAYENQISARNGINISAGNSVSLIGTQLSSVDGDISLQALQGGVNLLGAPGFWNYDYSRTTTKKRAFGLYKKRTTIRFDAHEDIYKRTSLTANNGDISIISSGENGDYASVLTAGTSFNANNIYVGTPNGNITAGTYSERSISSSTVNVSRKFIVSIGSETSKETNNIVINYGNDFAADDLLTLDAPKGTISIIGGTLKAERLNVTAKKLEIYAAINSAKKTFFSENDNGITITTINSGFDKETAQLPGIFVDTANQEFNIDGETNIRGFRGATLNNSLLTVIGSRRFDAELDPLYTSNAKTQATAAAKAIDDQYLVNFDLPGASDGQQFEYLDTLVRDYGATYHTIQLRDREWYDKQTRLNPAFQALLQIIATYATGGTAAGLGITNSFVAAGVNAASASVVSGVVGGAITGDIDVGSILKDATLAGVTATTTAFVTETINLGDALGLSDDSIFVNSIGDSSNFAPSAIVNRAGDLVISNGITNVFNGEDFFDNLDQVARSFVVGEALAITQFSIGEIGSGNANFEGSPLHLILHGGTGCVFSELAGGNCASGFFAGASQSVLAGSNLSDEQKIRLVPVISGLAAFPFADGNAFNVTFGSRIGVSGLENNYLSHTENQRYEDIVAECGVDCAEAVELRRLSAQRIRELSECSGNYSAACVQARNQLTLTVADYFDRVNQDTYLEASLPYRLFRSESVELLIRYGDDNDLDYRDTLPTTSFSSNAAISVLTDLPSNNELQLLSFVGPQAAINAADFGSGVVGAGVFSPFVTGLRGGRTNAQMIGDERISGRKSYTISSAQADPDKLTLPNGNPGTAQSRVNLKRVTNDNGNERGLNYALNRHGQNATTGENKSKFSISNNEVKTLLQNRDVVKSPVYNVRNPATGLIDANKFGRQVDVGRNVGTTRVNGETVNTSKITIITNQKGELINTFPGGL